ncbi:hypothetical protein MNBD_GAMMA26-1650, partial [hydrothermal vent metagenome]
MTVLKRQRQSCKLIGRALFVFLFLLVMPGGICLAEGEKSVPGFYPDLALDLTFDDNVRRSEEDE